MLPVQPHFKDKADKEEIAKIHHILAPTHNELEGLTRLRIGEFNELEPDHCL